MLLLALFALGVVTGPARPVDARHARLETRHGPLHVWMPRHYDRETAGVVVYVHGYFTDVDTAWRRHDLAAQFAASRLNAMFIACEAPRRLSDPVSWSSIAALLDAVASRHTLPAGGVTVVGHSAAHRTIGPWLGEDVVGTVILVDALYRDMPELIEWLAGDEERRLINAAVLTRPWSDALHAALPETLVVERFPEGVGLRDARGARVLYVLSQFDHMALVTGGVALPMLLQAVRLPVTPAN